MTAGGSKGRRAGRRWLPLAAAGCYSELRVDSSPNFDRGESMAAGKSLGGVRVHLAGSIPDDATPEQAEGMRKFAEHLATSVFRDGGSLLYGSQPSLVNPLRIAAERFATAGGRRD